MRGRYGPLRPELPAVATMLATEHENAAPNPASDRFARRYREAGKAAFLAETEPLGTPSVDGLEVDQMVPPERIAEQLKLRKTAKVVCRDRRYLIDDIPVELATTYVTLTVARGTLITTQDTGPGGVYARIEEAGHKLGSFTEEVGARMPTLRSVVVLPSRRARRSFPSRASPSMSRVGRSR